MVASTPASSSSSERSSAAAAAILSSSSSSTSESSPTWLGACVGLIMSKGSPVPCNDFDDIPSADVCDDVSAVEDDVLWQCMLCVMCVVAGEFSPLFFFPFFAPKFVEAHSLKNMPTAATFSGCGLQLSSRWGCNSRHAEDATLVTLISRNATLVYVGLLQIQDLFHHVQHERDISDLLLVRR